MNKILVISILLSVYILPQSNLKQKGTDQITAQALLKNVEFLASPELNGRLAGSPGYNKASKFAASEMKKLKLKPFGKNGFYQEFPVEYNNIISPAGFSSISANGVTKEYKLGSEYVFRGFTGSGNITANVVFCGYGLTVPGYDDYKNIDVKNKIVMIFKYAPSWKLNDTSSWGETSLRHKIKLASDKGALAILFVSTPNDADPQKPLLSILEGEGEQNIHFPSLHAGLEAAADLLNGSNYSLKQLQTKIDSTRKPFSVPTPNSAHIIATAKYTKEQKTQNIIGMIEGSDPKLKDEYVVIGAHLDHVGGQAGQIYAPGANDNASGSSAVLEIMKSFSKNNIFPKRSVIFVLFASEEIGLEGAKHFVNDPPLPLKQIKTMINIDCIGAGDSLQVGCKKEYPSLWNLVKSNDTKDNVIVETSFGPGADAAPFHEKGIQSVYFATTNGYKDLHLTTDVPSKLNKALYEKAVRIIFKTAFDIAMGADL